MAKYGYGIVHSAKILSAALIGVMSVGCATYEGAGNTPFENTTNGGFDLSAGTSLGAQMNREDKTVMRNAFVQAMSGPQNSSVPWSSRRMSGSVEAGQFHLANLIGNPDTVLRAPAGIDVRSRVETEKGAHVLKKNSNIRLGPSTDFAIVTTLPAGTGVEGLGSVEGAPWMLVGVDGAVIGYVFEELIVKAPGSGLLDLAGGPVRKPILCRAYEMSAQLSGQNLDDRWGGMACDYGNGFEPQKIYGPTAL